MGRKLIKTAAQFGIAGPPIGGALYFVPILLLEQASVGVDDLLTTLVGCAGFSYAFGLLPSVATGIVLGLMNVRGRRKSWHLEAALVGLVMGILLGVCFDLLVARGSRSYEFFGPIFLGIPSCISALVCSYMFKPTTKADCIPRISN